MSSNETVNIFSHLLWASNKIVNIIEEEYRRMVITEGFQKRRELWTVIA
jgi:hypothetical protein